MNKRFYEFTNKEIKVYDAETSIAELVWESVVNFFWGFTANFMVPFIAAKYDPGVLVSFGAYYFVISHVLNRASYTTKLGRYVVMPVPAIIGAFVSYKLGYLLIHHLK